MFQAYAIPNCRLTAALPWPSNATNSGNWKPLTTATGKTTIAMTTNQPDKTCENVSDPADQRPTKSASRSPRASGNAASTASAAQVTASTDQLGRTQRNTTW